MVNNTMKVRNGVNIELNRAHKAIPDYTIPNQFKISIDTPDVTFTDTALATLIPISGSETADDCSATTGWTASGTNSVSVNSTTYKEDGGTNGALNIIKSDTSSATISISKTVASLDGTSKDLSFWIYVINATALAKISTSAVRYGSDSGNYYLYAITLTSGWNYIKLAVPDDFDSTVGSPSISALDYFYFDIVTGSTSDTFSAGDIIIDSIRLVSSDDYVKAIDSVAFDETDASVSTISKITVSEANGFLINGHALFNTDATPLMSDKSKFPDNSKSSSDLFKITVKRKLRNIN